MASELDSAEMELATGDYVASSTYSSHIYLYLWQTCASMEWGTYVRAYAYMRAVAKSPRLRRSLPSEYE